MTGSDRAVPAGDAVPADDALPGNGAVLAGGTDGGMLAAGVAAAPSGAARRLSRRAILAHRDLRVLLALRAVLAILGACIAVAAAIGLARAGIVNHLFPAFLPGDESTVITSYSGPLLATAIGVGAIAGLLLVSAVTDLWRRSLMGASLAGSHAGLGQ